MPLHRSPHELAVDIMDSLFRSQLAQIVHLNAALPSRHDWCAGLSQMNMNAMIRDQLKDVEAATRYPEKNVEKTRKRKASGAHLASLQPLP